MTTSPDARSRPHKTPGTREKIVSLFGRSRVWLNSEAIAARTGVRNKKGSLTERLSELVTEGFLELRPSPEGEGRIEWRRAVAEDLQTEPRKP